VSYRELEEAGVVTARARRGTVVPDGPWPLAKRERRQLLADAARTFVAEAIRVGADPTDAPAAADAAVQEVEKKAGRPAAPASPSGA
jgi:DNA-binding transcriptional regulator YhcF (GntR family)